MHRTTARSSLLDVRERSAITSDAYDPGTDRSASPQLKIELPTSSANDTRMLSILEGPPLTGEPRVETFKRKERALAEVFAALPPAESLCLERRLANPARGDVLAARFATLVPERRARLLAFLAHSRWSRSSATVCR
jgi:hypothetical protein